jgi:hypothetical protein
VQRGIDANKEFFIDGLYIINGPIVATLLSSIELLFDSIVVCHSPELKASISATLLQNCYRVKVVCHPWEQGIFELYYERPQARVELITIVAFNA